MPLPLALLSVAPLAFLGIVGGGGVWLGWSPRLALISSGAWIIFAIALLVAGGNPGLLAFATMLLGVILSGAWERRQQGSRLLDLFTRGE